MINPIPAILDPMVAGGKTVKIVVRIVQGDNLAIERIDGKPYHNPESGER